MAIWIRSKRGLRQKLMKKDSNKGLEMTLLNQRWTLQVCPLLAVLTSPMEVDDAVWGATSASSSTTRVPNNARCTVAATCAKPYSYCRPTQHGWNDGYDAGSSRKSSTRPPGIPRSHDVNASKLDGMTHQEQSNAEVASWDISRVSSWEISRVLPWSEQTLPPLALAYKHRTVESDEDKIELKRLHLILAGLSRTIMISGIE